MTQSHVEQQREMLARARSLATEFATRAAEHDRTGTFPFENFDALRAANFTALHVPKAHGGMGATLLETTMLLEELATGDGSTALGFCMHAHTMSGAAEGNNWPKPLFERVCKAALEEGALINAIASEPELGSITRGGKPKTTATPVHNESGEITGWRLDGHKTYASLSPALRFMIIPAVMQDGSDETARFVVDVAQAAPGTIEIVETWNTLGMRATGSHDVMLLGVVVDSEALLSRGASPSEAGMGLLSAWFMLGTSAVYLGIALGGLNIASRYALERVPTGLGKPIAEVEGIRRQLGQAEMLLRQGRMIVHHVASLHDASVRQTPTIYGDIPAAAQVSPQIAVAKVTATNNAVAAMELCMRVVGGQSLSRDFPLERHFRDVRAGLSHPINDEAAYLLLGKMALERVASNKQ